MKKFRIMKLVFLISVPVIITLWYFNFFHSKHLNSDSNANQRKDFSAEQYLQLKKNISSDLKKIKQSSIDQQRKFAFKMIYDSLMPYWYDTEWDFNGTTEVPRQGKIACGYFVTTLLRDAGFEIDRTALAVCASEQMIKTLTTENHIKRYSNFKIEKFVEAVKKHGEGIFIVGLDNHTGFLVNDGNELYFIHANGWFPSKVIKEKALESGPLSRSAYRVVGYLTENENLYTKSGN